MPPLTPGEGIQRPLLGFRGLLTLVMHINSCRPTHIDTKIISLFSKKKKKIIAVGARLDLKVSSDRMPQTLASSLEEKGGVRSRQGSL